MSQFPNSRHPSSRKAFEITQTEDTVTIITRDPGTNEIAKVVTFSGSDTPDRDWASHRLTSEANNFRRW